MSHEERAILVGLRSLAVQLRAADEEVQQMQNRLLAVSGRLRVALDRLTDLEQRAQSVVGDASRAVSS